jgi:hypothetical protein
MADNMLFVLTEVARLQAELASLRNRVTDLDDDSFADREEIQWGGGEQALAYSFRVYEEGGRIYVVSGYRAATDEDWFEVAGKDWAEGSGGVVYMVRTFPVVDEEGTITTPGSWGELEYGDPPDMDETRHVVRIAKVLVTDGNPTEVTHEHLGNIYVHDIADCSSGE